MLKKPDNDFLSEHDSIKWLEKFMDGKKKEPADLTMSVVMCVY